VDDRVEQILKRLDEPNVPILKLLDECRSGSSEYDRLWREHPELYDRFTELLIQKGHAARAFDLARERWRHIGIRSGEEDQVPEGPEIRYRLALAVARGGNPAYAERLLKPILSAARQSDAMPVALRVKIVALRGRIEKDLADTDPARLSKAIEWYREAAAIPGAAELPDRATYPLVNLANLLRVIGRVEEARDVAAEVVRRAKPLAATAAPNDHWIHATLGEASLILDDRDASLEHYRRAVAIMNDRRLDGDLITMRRNVLRLAKVGAVADIEWIEEHVGSVVVFSGHMIDAPDRARRGLAPRFPQSAELEGAVRHQIVHHLQARNAKVGFSSLACGSDILFAEVMLEREAELHVVLPFAKDDFVRTSVTFGSAMPAWENWRRRFEAVLQAVGRDRIHYATTEPYLDTPALFEFVNTVTQGLAVLRARERSVPPHALTVLDTASTALAGGTKYFLEEWRQANHTVDVVELGILRDAAKLATAPPPKPRPPAREPDATGLIQRTIKAILFADVEGYSKIPDADLQSFLFNYGELLQDLFRLPIGDRALYANTWGDGLHVVFEHVTDAAEFATTLLNPLPALGRGWESLGFDVGAPVRVALHAGPVYRIPDIFQDRDGYSGEHVSRAARIEPVTMPGCAYASEQFAALLAIHDRDRRFRCDSVGIHELAKNYDRCPLYQIQRAAG
jgi:class 3 adenylate cyclase/tetratricopeptide (TPR) repeat protein